MRRCCAVLTVLFLCALALSPMARAQPRPQVFQLHTAEAGNVAGTAISTFGYPSVTVDNSIAAAWDGTLNYEGNYPSIGFVAVQCVNQATNLVVTTTTGAASVRCNITGAQQFRARVSGRTVGTVTATAAIMSGGESGMAAVTLSNTLVDDAAFGVATDRVFPAGYLFDDVAPDSVNEGDIGAPRMSANRVPYATIRDGAGNERGANVNANNALLAALDQTTPATTNGVTPVPTSNAAAANALTSSGAAEGSNVLKASAGNLYAITITTGATAGYLMIFNATSAPVDGAVTPAYCVQAPANMSSALEWSIPVRFSTGITAVFSSTGCFTKTVSATAAFFAQVN